MNLLHADETYAPRRARKNAQIIPIWRALHSKEVAIVDWLLKHGEPHASGFLSQLNAVRVYPSCSCGCPSVAMMVFSLVPVSFPLRRFVSCAIGDVDGRCVDVQLTQENGYLSGLDVSMVNPVESRYDLPDVETLAWYGRL